MLTILGKVAKVLQGVYGNQYGEEQNVQQERKTRAIIKHFQVYWSRRLVRIPLPPGNFLPSKESKTSGQTEGTSLSVIMIPCLAVVRMLGTTTVIMITEVLSLWNLDCLQGMKL